MSNPIETTFAFAVSFAVTIIVAATLLTVPILALLALFGIGCALIGWSLRKPEPPYRPPTYVTTSSWTARGDIVR